MSKQNHEYDSDIVRLGAALAAAHAISDTIAVYRLSGRWTPEIEAFLDEVHARAVELIDGSILT